MDVDGFYRNLQEKHNTVVALLDQYFHIVIKPAVSAQDAGNALLQLGRAADTLASQMAAGDRPQWLRELIKITKAFENNQGDQNLWKNAFNLIKANEALIRGQNWSRTSSNAIPLLDFDEIVEKHRNKENIERLFKQLIDSLEKLVQCEELDSRRVVEDLERLIASLRKAQRGSFNAQILSFEVAKKYVKNLTISWLKETKVAKLMVKAAEDTVSELGMTLDDARNKIQEEISVVQTDLEQRLSESTPRQITAAHSEMSQPEPKVIDGKPE